MVTSRQSRRRGIAAGHSALGRGAVREAYAAYDRALSWLRGEDAPRRMRVRALFGMAQAGFWVYAGLWGIWIAPLFYVYTGDSIARVFFITAGAFAGMSLFGYTTKRNLGPIGAFLTMATFGILLALLLNIFLLQSQTFDLILSVVVVLVFAGLTAYDTQWIKNAYYAADEGDVVTRKAIFGAFHLYGDFVVLFVWLMHLLGVMRE